MHGLTVGERRGHHQILGAGDGHGVEHQARALEPLGAGADVAAFDVDVRAHRLQAGDVDVHRPRADGAAAGQRHVGAAESRQQRPEHQDRGTHRLDQLVGREVFADRARIDLDAHALVDRHRHAHAAEQFDRRGDVLQVRHVADRHRPVGQQRAGQDRQRRILGAGDAHFALERNAALDLEFIHARGVPRAARRPLLRRVGLDRQRMYFAPDTLTQRAIDQLVTGNAAQALERLAHQQAPQNGCCRRNARRPARPASPGGSGPRSVVGP